MPDHVPPRFPAPGELTRRDLLCQTTFLAAAGLLGVRTRDVLAADDQAGIRLLFAGSSSTYWNDMPAAVARTVNEKITGHEGRPVRSEIVGRSGSDIRVYLEPGFADYQYGVKPGQTFLDKIREERFDIVVLMVVCRFITAEVTEPGAVSHAEAVTRYCEAIRAAGGVPYFYEMGWGRGEAEAEGRARILALAQRNNVTGFAPCSSAWARVYEERPDLKLQHPHDASHPGDLGHFLNLACFYAALTHQNPAGAIPRQQHVWPHFNQAEKAARKDEMDAAFNRFQPDDYQARLPEWMQRNGALGLVADIPEETARYLESVAWEAWQTASGALQVKHG